MTRRRLLCPITLAVVVSPWAFASTSIYLSPDQLATAAPIVLEGTVEDVASGYDPVTKAVSTYVTLHVTAVHRGPPDLDRVVLREPGGRFAGLVHEVDAVPVFREGQRVLVFAEPGRDGALRSAGMFFGTFLLDGGTGRTPIRARREMSGRGTILRAPPDVMEDFPLPDLVSLVASTPERRPGEARPWRAVPPELDRIQWEEPLPGDTIVAAPTPQGGTPALAATPTSPTAVRPEFVSLTPSYPVRWEEVDASIAVTADLERGRNPLGDDDAAAAEISRAMAAWTNVPEARIALALGNSDARFTEANPRSPADAYPPTSVLLFGDPYDDLSDPISCGGTLAMGGYWRSTTPGRVVNNVTFYPARRLYVIFNRGFECFLGDPLNLAEIAAHELGHAIGLGHSAATGSIMRPFAYGDRGAVLGLDDRDAVHCLYPHTLTVTSPAGGETWSAGTVRPILWKSSAEAGPDPGTVDLDLSTDAGATWAPIARGEPNDGSFTWVVPNLPGGRGRIRVSRGAVAGPPPAPYPLRCSQDASNANFTILAGPGPAGTVPDGRSGAPLRVARSASGALVVSWGATCGRATNYALYEGSLDALRLGAWDPKPATCAAGADREATVASSPGARYFLATSLAGVVEGPLGADSSGRQRPVPPTVCGVRETTTCP